MKIDWSFLWDRNAKKLDQQFTDWLYDDWSKEKYEEYKFLDQIPGIHQYMDYLLDIRSDNEYLERYGMDYSDIHDPRKLSQTGSAHGLTSFGQMVVSKNINRLYK